MTKKDLIRGRSIFNSADIVYLYTSINTENGVRYLIFKEDYHNKNKFKLTTIDEFQINHYFWEIPAHSLEEKYGESK